MTDCFDVVDVVVVGCIDGDVVRGIDVVAVAVVGDTPYPFYK